MGVLLGGSPESTKVQMQAVLEFETNLANITTPSEQRRDEQSLYNLKTVAELQEMAPFVRADPLGYDPPILINLVIKANFRSTGWISFATPCGA